MKRGWLANSLISVAVLGMWGLFSKLAVRDLDWVQVVLMYYAISLAAMVTVYRRRGESTAWLRRETWVAVASGLAGTGGLITFYLALEGQKASLVVPLIAGAYPVLTAMLAGIVLRERLGRMALAGVAFAIAAIVLISIG